MNYIYRSSYFLPSTVSLPLICSRVCDVGQAAEGMENFPDLPSYVTVPVSTVTFLSISLILVYAYLLFWTSWLEFI